LDVRAQVKLKVVKNDSKSTICRECISSTFVVLIKADRLTGENMYWSVVFTLVDAAVVPT